MSQQNERPFYVGYLPVPPGLKMFLVTTAGVLVGMFAALALAIGGAQDKPGNSAFQWGWGAQTVTGTVRVDLYKGTVRANGRKSPYSLYDESISTMEAGGDFNQDDSTGFLRIQGLPVKIQASVQAKVKP